MSVTLSDITSIVRNLIEDYAKTGKDIFTYGSSNIFTLTESNVSSVTTVLVNDISSGVSYTYSSSTNKVTVSSSLTSGDTVEVDYSYYPNYSDTELENYVKNALVYLSISNYYTFTVDTDDDEIYPDPTEKEKNLLAMVAAIIIEPDNKNYRLPDISISVPSSSLPTDEKIRRTIAIMKKNVHGLFFISD